MNCDKELKEFMEDIGCLEPIESFVGRVNVFNVLGLEKLETRHSYMLKWLLDPNENHGLGDRVLRGVIQLVCGEKDMDYSSFLIERETSDIDILAHSFREKFLLCIENKIKAPETGDQLVKYKGFLSEKFPDYRRVFVFLSPTGKKSSDPDTWVSLSYSEVMNVIEKARTTSETQSQADLLIRSYVEMVTGDFREESNKVRKICKNVYRKHRKALEMIFEVNSGLWHDISSDVISVCEDIYWHHKKAIRQIWENRPESSGNSVKEIIKKWALQQESLGRIRIKPEKKDKKYIRFNTPEMSKYFPDVPGGASAWGTDQFYYYEINIQMEKQTPEQAIAIKLSIDKKNLPADLRKTYEKINERYSERNQNRYYSENFSTKTILISEAAEEETIINQMNEYLDQLFTFESKLDEYMEQLPQ